MSQAEWSFTEAQWTAYISQQAGLREEVKVQQLRAACDQALLRRVYDDGGLAALDTEAKLLAKPHLLLLPACSTLTLLLPTSHPTSS